MRRIRSVGPPLQWISKMIREQLKADIELYVSGAPTLGIPVARLTAANVTGAAQVKHTAPRKAVARVGTVSGVRGVVRVRRSSMAATANRKAAIYTTRLMPGGSVQLAVGGEGRREVFCDPRVTPIQL
jgi:hypothetical protein